MPPARSVAGSVRLHFETVLILQSYIIQTELLRRLVVAEQFGIPTPANNRAKCIFCVIGRMSPQARPGTAPQKHGGYRVHRASGAHDAPVAAVRGRRVAAARRAVAVADFAMLEEGDIQLTEGANGSRAQTPRNASNCLPRPCPLMCRRDLYRAAQLAPPLGRPSGWCRPDATAPQRSSASSAQEHGRRVMRP